MQNLLSKSTAVAIATMALSVAIPQQAQAISFSFDWQGDLGYSATGAFSYDQTTAPTIISEAGAGPTTTLESLVIAFFDPADNPLQSFNTVTSGVSNSSFFAFNFDTSTQSLFGNFNVGGGTGTIGEQFFNGTIGGLLRLRAIGSPSDILLDSQDPGVITVSQIPEPTSLILGLLGLGLLGVRSGHGFQGGPNVW